MTVLITMAGRGSRFRDRGYDCPKYEIMVHGRSLFDWAILSVTDLLKHDDRVVFVTLKENQSRGYLNNACDRLGIEDFGLIELDALTDGQATTAILAKPELNVENALFIYNIDTLVRPRDLLLPPGFAKADGWIPCFRAQGDHWSFIKVGRDGFAVDAAEKRRISDMATVGLYGFSSFAEYEDAYNKHYGSSRELDAGERYIAPIYRTMITAGKKLAVTEVLPENVCPLGTPDEVDAFAAMASEFVKAQFL